jgi:hypothetical protein
MVAVAVAGLLMGGIVGGFRLKRRHARFVSRLQFHAKWEQSWRREEIPVREALRRRDQLMRLVEERRHLGYNSRPDVEKLRSMVEPQRQNAIRLSRMIAYHAAMARKYEDAARYAWLPVEPDPPEPEWPE